MERESEAESDWEAQDISDREEIISDRDERIGDTDSNIHEGLARGRVENVLLNENPVPASSLSW